MSTVCASEYGGPSDPTSGVHGYHGDNLTGRMAFAELNMGTALGGLPYRSKLRISYGGRSVVAEKLDIGLGGAGCGGHPRAIDLWWETARALGFNGLAPVEVTGGATVQAQNASLLTPFGGGDPGKAFKEGFEQFELPGNPIGGAQSFFNAVTGLIKLLTSKEGWIRIGKVLIGLFLLLTGLLGMAKIEATKVVTRGAETAALIPK